MMTVSEYLFMNAVMLAIGIVYAAILDQKQVYRWFYPKRTWVTVVIGVLLCGIPLFILWWRGNVPTFILILYITVFADVGLPIGIWQHQNGEKLDQEAKEARER